MPVEPGDRGISSVQFLLSSALGLLMFLILANLVVVQYGRGAIRSALEQGARAGALTEDATECVARAEEVIGQLLGGRMSDGLDLECTASGSAMVASGTGSFESWTPMIPDFEIAIRSEAVLEANP